MYSIIIIDDDRNAIRDLIEGTDWKSLECRVADIAENGRRGIETVEKLKPDLVLVDSQMPGMGGLEMISRLKCRGLCENFIIMTEKRDFEEARQAIQSGVRGLLVKPVKAAELEDTVRRIFPDAGEEKNDKVEKQLLAVRNRRNQYSIHVAEAVAYIDTHIYTELSLTSLCEAVELSPSYFSRLFKKETGIGFQAYAQMAKMSQARKLLRDSHARVYKVAEMLGYHDYTYFFQVFKRIYGFPPSGGKG